MLWIDAYTIFYASAFGGLVGAAVMALANRHIHRYNMNLLEKYWQTDIKYLRELITRRDKSGSDGKLSPKSVDKSGYKYRNFNHNKPRC